MVVEETMLCAIAMSTPREDIEEDWGVGQFDVKSL
jgi:hypothetical protein